MNWDAIGAVGEIIGALAVVFSIVYLAIQIRQNAKSLQSTVEQSISNQFSSITANASMSNIPGLLIRASKDPSELTDEEIGQVTMYTSALLRTFEHAHYQYRLGNLSRETWDAFEPSMVAVMSSDLNRRYWYLRADTFQTDFRVALQRILEETPARTSVDVMTELRKTDQTSQNTMDSDT
jgi:hypothetical protein